MKKRLLAAIFSVALIGGLSPAALASHVGYITSVEMKGDSSLSCPLTFTYVETGNPGANPDETHGVYIGSPQFNEFYALIMTAYTTGSGVTFWSPADSQYQDGGSAVNDCGSGEPAEITGMSMW